MRFAWCVVGLGLVAGCGSSTNGDDFPTGPGGGGGGGGGGTGIDAPTPVPDATADAAPLDAPPPDAPPPIDAPPDAYVADAFIAPISGRVCLVADFRNVRACAATGAGGFTVMLGEQMATTRADGSFDILPSTDPDPVWRVSGATLVTSLVPYGSEVTHLPTITTANYAALMDANDIDLLAFEGSIHARVVRNDIPVAGASAATSDGSAQYAPRYDNNASKDAWLTNATGVQGAVWLPGPDGGNRTVRFFATAGSAGLTHSIPVEARAITYVTIPVQ